MEKRDGDESFSAAWLGLWSKRYVELCQATY
jgi:hypothetical protein